MRSLLYLISPAFFMGGALLVFKQSPAPEAHFFSLLGLTPYLLLGVSLFLSFQFNRTRLFFIQVIFLLLYLTPYFLLPNMVGVNLFIAILLFPIILLLAILPERGIFTLTALPRYIVILSGIFAVAWLSMEQPTIVMSWVERSYTPARYFDWTLLSQSSILVMFVCFIFALAFYIARPSLDAAGVLGVLVASATILHNDFEGLLVTYVAIACALMFVSLVLQETYRMAYIDELTALPGRRALKEKMQNLSGCYSVAMLDIDHFKKFNDTYGHDAGDSVLRMVGGRFKNFDGGKAFRYGGEEFAILFKGKDVKESEGLCEELRRSIASTDFVIRKQDRRRKLKKFKKARFVNKAVTVTVSIGVAENTSHMDGAWDVLKSADKALYRAKKKGRNRTSK